MTATDRDVKPDNVPKLPLDDFACSFCSKWRREVQKLISGPRVFICDECIELCAQIMADESREEFTTIRVVGGHTAALATLAAARDAELVQLRSDIRAAREESRRYRAALVKAGNAIADVTVQPFVRCMWCQLELADEAAAREHVGNCDKHPAVIKLRELEAATPAKGRRRR